jgi:hypothetical protein
MKRIILCVVAALVLSVLAVHGAWALGVKDVVAMHQAGIPDSLIVAKIRHSGTAFHLNSKDLVALHEAGVSDHVVAVMLRTEDRHDYDYGSYWPWGYPRVLVGFDFAYDPWYGYWPYHGPRAFGSYRFGHPGFRRFGSGFRRR